MTFPRKKLTAMSRQTYAEVWMRFARRAYIPWQPFLAAWWNSMDFIDEMERSDD